MPNFIIDDIKLTIEQLENQINSIIDHVLLIIKESDDLLSRYKLITSMKGVAHAGLFPREFQSGSSVNKRTSIGKIGNRYIREALYMGALSASSHEPHVRAFYHPSN